MTNFGVDVSGVRWRRCLQILTKKYGLTLKADAARFLRDDILQPLAVASDAEFMRTIEDIASGYIQQGIYSCAAFPNH